MVVKEGRCFEVACL